MDDVPTQPIAFVRAQVSEGLMRLDDFKQALRIAQLDKQQKQQAKIKRRTVVALITVPTREVRVVQEIAEGALPLDWTGDGYVLLVGERRYGRGQIALSLWNRQTGSFDRVRPSQSAGLASFSRGAIRLANVEQLRETGKRPGVVMHVRGRGRVEVVGAEDGNEPHISPDGRHVVFTRIPRRSSRSPMIFVATLGEREVRPLGRGRQPRFSQDGRWISFSRDRDGQRDIWLMRSNGTAKRAITSSNYDEDAPAVSEDGRYVVYGSVRGNQLDQSQLFLTRVSDLHEIQITHSGQNARPIW
jgi:tricorn protease-like protein